MTSRSLQEIQEERKKNRAGLAAQGFFGCFTFLISLGAAMGVFWWVDQNYPLRHLFNISKEALPDPYMEILAILVLLVFIHTILTIIVGFFRRITGKDQKVQDKLDELQDHWDDIQY